MVALTAGLTLAVFATATLSGLFGMAGGMVLMAVLVLAMPVTSAMVIHGVAQGTSNGSRTWFLRQHIVWSILPWYLAGSVVAIAGFLVLAAVPDRALILIAIGLFPWLGRVTPMLRGLTVEHPPTAVLCGVVVTAAQLVAGASGPLLDVFYLNTQLNRHQVIASKALTQTIGHAAKIGCYAWLGVSLAGLDATLTWVAALAIPAAIAGARTGTWLLDQLSEEGFRRYSEWIILTLATLCLITGVADLLSR